MKTGRPAKTKRAAASVPADSGVEQLKHDLVENLTRIQGQFPAVPTRNDWYMAAAHTVRDRILKYWVDSSQAYYQRKARTVCYLSAEFLIGPQLGMNLVRLGPTQQRRQAVAELGLELDDLIACEEEPGLGNGGLGRL